MASWNEIVNNIQTLNPQAMAQYLEKLMIDSLKRVSQIRDNKIEQYEHKIERQSYYMDKLIKLHNDIVDLTWSGNTELRKWVCMQPFNKIYIGENGIVSPCCLYRIKYGAYFGNINKNSFEEIWNSDNAKRLRYGVAKGNFEYCDRACPVINNPVAYQDPMLMLPRESVNFNFSTWHDCSIDTGPNVISLNCDSTCNLHCPSCRGRGRGTVNSNDKNQKIRKMLEILRPALKNCKVLQTDGSGEFFASKPIFEFLQTLTQEEFPLLKLSIMTNGQLFTPERWGKLSNLKGMVDIVKVSADAAEKETYEKIRMGGRWETLCENMDYISSLKAAGDIKRIQMNFVVQKSNFKQMKNYVRLAKKWNADIVNFTRLRNWGTFSQSEFKDLDVFLPENPLYNEAVGEMQDTLQEKGITIQAGQFTGGKDDEDAL